MNKLAVFFLLFSSLAQAGYEYHEMMLGCVATKRECTTLARQRGYRPLRTVKDPARCSGAKPRACIVFH